MVGALQQKIPSRLPSLPLEFRVGSLIQILPQSVPFVLKVVGMEFLLLVDPVVLFKIIPSRTCLMASILESYVKLSIREMMDHFCYLMRIYLDYNVQLSLSF